MKVLICNGRTCSARGSKYIVARLQWDISRLSYQNVDVETCLCQWNCDYGPTVLFGDKKFSHMNPVKASEELARLVNQAKKSFQKPSWK